MIASLTDYFSATYYFILLLIFYVNICVYKCVYVYILSIQARNLNVSFYILLYLTNSHPSNYSWKIYREIWGCLYPLLPPAMHFQIVPRMTI